MCTVTFIPPNTSKGFILTSNRDERSFRPTIPPQIYKHGDIQICYPKDSEAGGSWIATNNKGRICCLLNGGLFPHRKQEFHTISRGQILLLAVSESNSSLSPLQKEDLSKVQPFTMITLDIRDNKIMYFNEFVWDGTHKHFKELSPDVPQIWSSVTLYSQTQRKHRILWFDAFQEKNKDSITPENVYNFHSGTHTADSTINVVMEREDDLKTVSITQITHEANKTNMRYVDLLEQKEYLVEN